MQLQSIRTAHITYLGFGRQPLLCKCSVPPHVSSSGLSGVTWRKSPCPRENWEVLNGAHLEDALAPPTATPHHTTCGRFDDECSSHTLRFVPETVH